MTRNKIPTLNLWVFITVEVIFALVSKFKNPNVALEDEFFFFWAIMAFFFGMVGYFGLERRGVPQGQRLYDQLNSQELGSWYRQLTGKFSESGANDALLAIPLFANLIIYVILIQF